MRIAVSVIALVMVGALAALSEAYYKDSADGGWGDWMEDTWVGDAVDWVGGAVDEVVDWVGEKADFVGGAFQGAGDMWRGYSDMRDANTIGADKYFHARGNYDASQRGPGGRWAAEVISDAREAWQSGVGGRGAEDTAADQEANVWGRNGGDPNRYRPEGLPERYQRTFP